MSTPDTLIDPRPALTLCHRSVEFRATEPVGDGRTLEGYAAVFDSPTMIDSWEGEFEEVVKRGAFRKTLRERDPVLQFDHGRDKRTGSVPIGAIRELREDDLGLYVAARLFDNDVVKPIRQAVEGQAVRGMSFRFQVIQDRWIDSSGRGVDGDELAELMHDPGDRGPLRREITEVKLFELGPVVFPAYDSTSVGVRGVLGQFDLDERCVRRHLSLFGAKERRILAEELVSAFPELGTLLSDRTASPNHDTSTTEGTWSASHLPDGEEDDEASSDAAAPGTSDAENSEAAASSTSGKVEPVTIHSAHLGEGAPGWYLPSPGGP